MPQFRALPHQRREQRYRRDLHFSAKTQLVPLTALTMNAESLCMHSVTEPNSLGPRALVDLSVPGFTPTWTGADIHTFAYKAVGHWFLSGGLSPGVFYEACAAALMSAYPERPPGPWDACICLDESVEKAAFQSHETVPHAAPAANRKEKSPASLKPEEEYEKQSSNPERISGRRRKVPLYWS